MARRERRQRRASRQWCHRHRTIRRTRPRRWTRRIIISCGRANRREHRARRRREECRTISTNRVMRRRKNNRMVGSRIIVRRLIVSVSRLVTVYLNYTDDNSGMLLNPQKFYHSMPSVFGPAETDTVLTAIFNACVKCAFKPVAFIRRILDIFHTPKDDGNNESHTRIKRRSPIAFRTGTTSFDSS